MTLFRKTIIRLVGSICIMSAVWWLERQFMEGAISHTRASTQPMNIEVPNSNNDVQRTYSHRYDKKSTQIIKDDKKLRKGTEMRSRAEQLQKRCKARENLGFKNSSHLNYLDNIAVDQKNRVLFCLIPKVASTNFRNAYLATTGVVSNTKAWTMSGGEVYRKYGKKFTMLINFNDFERKEIIHSYKKILFVRDPLEKLLSGYRSKFFHHLISCRNIYYNAINNFYREFSDLGKKRNIHINATTKNITFTDFLTYWTDVLEVGLQIDSHFALSSDLCRPCTLAYDYIGNFDTLYEDVDFIYHNLSMNVQFPKYSGKRTADNLKESYKDVPKQLLRNVLKYLSADFELFGYPVPDWMS